MIKEPSNPFRSKHWSPYVVGIGIGILSWFSFATVNKTIGITSAFANTAAIIERAAVPAVATQNPYYAAKEQEKKSPQINWEWMLVVGVFLGAFLSSRLSGDRVKEKVPGLWAHRFGAGVGKRYLGAFFGGALMMLGARVAGGCTSGHGISGGLQLALSSWIFVLVMFATGILTAHLLFGREGRDYVR